MSDDQPLALVASGRRGITITAVNACAAAEGVHAGQALVDARAVLPGLRSLPADTERDNAELLALAHWCGRYGPRRNCHGADGVWIDVSGVAHLFGGEAELVRDLIARLKGFGFSVQAGLADSLGAAHALARFGVEDGRRPFVIARPGGLDETLRLLPVEALRMSPETVVTLKRLGLRRIGQLYDLPRASLARRFQESREPRKRGGKRRLEATETGGARVTALMRRLDQARGLRAEPLPALGEPARFGVRRSWAEPLISAEALTGEINELALSLGQSLEKSGRGWRRVRLSLYRSDGTVAEAEAGTSVASRDVDHLMRLFDERLAQIDAGFGIDVAVLDAVKVGIMTADQETLGIDRGGGAREADGLARLVDRLVNCLDGARVIELAPRDSHVPEYAEARRPAFDFARQDAGGDRHLPRHGARVRPALLLDPPEPISVVAEVPDGPPARFLWRRVVHRVVRAAGPERIAPEWWREIGLPEGQRSRVRDYYRVEVAGGGCCWVFRAGLYGDADSTRPPAWFVHGLFG